ncbi:hypothetical protein ACWDKQ_09515 [Saccharopolyspora sp. NPDC000995]
MATSPLSQRLRDLGRDLGAVPFERDSHPVQLTGAGATPQPIVKYVLCRFFNIPRRLREAVGPHPAVVCIGIAPGLDSSVRLRLKAFATTNAPPSAAQALAERQQRPARWRAARRTHDGAGAPAGARRKWRDRRSHAIVRASTPLIN